MKNLKKCATFVLTFIMFLNTAAAFGEEGSFSDVPKNHWAYEYIERLKGLGITDGVGGGRFGLGEPLTKVEYAAFLCKLMGFELVYPEKGSFADNTDKSRWEYAFIETAAANGLIDTTLTHCYPNALITREEMAVMTVKALGYGDIAEQMKNTESFSDVTNNKGYIAVAKDLGIISGVSESHFEPSGNALREHAAKIMTEIYEGINRETQFKNAFYAINSYSQISYIESLDAVSFGWCRLELNDKITVNTSSAGNNEYRVPAGYETAYSAAEGKTRMLMAAVGTSDALNIVLNPALREEAANALAEAVNALSVPNSQDKIEFDGIVVDFENLKGEEAAKGLNQLIILLKARLDETDKKMYVAIHPKTSDGIYFDGYDYKTIGEVADTVILMAHDYNAKYLSEFEMSMGVTFTPLAPIESVYYALKAVTDPDTGIDKSKIALQISFGTAQWKLKDGKTINQTPYTPAFSQIEERIAQGAEVLYSTKYESPYVTFFNTQDGTENIVWYENQQSVSAKIRLAKLFGIVNFSFWRLGTISDFDINFR